MSESSVAVSAVATSRHEHVVLPSERVTPGTDAEYWLGRLSRANRKLAWSKALGRVDEANFIAAEWRIVCALLRAGATDMDIVGFLLRYAVGARMRKLATDHRKWVGGMRRRWSNPARQDRMEGTLAATVAALDTHWLTMKADRWTAYVGFLGVSVKAAKACTLVDVTCSQREVEAATGTPGQTVWRSLGELPFVTVNGPSGLVTGTEFTISAPVGDDARVPYRPARLDVLRLAQHPAVLGKVVSGRMLLTYATVAAGATTVEQVATAWCISVRTARGWVATTAKTGALVVTADGVVTLGTSLDDIAMAAGVVEARAAMRDRHQRARERQRAHVAARAARRLPNDRYDAPDINDEVEEEVHEGTPLTRFVEAVDAPNVPQGLVIRVARDLYEDLLRRCGGDLDRAVEAAWVAGAAVTAWAWARDAVEPEWAARKPGPVLTVARHALVEHLLGRPDDLVLAAAGRRGGKLRRPLSLEQRIARSRRDKAARLKRSIERANAQPKTAQRLPLAVTPRIYQDVPAPVARLAIALQRDTTNAVRAVHSSGVVDALTLVAAWRRALMDAANAAVAAGVVDVEDQDAFAVDATLVGLRTALAEGGYDVLVPNIARETGLVGATSDNGGARVIRLEQRTDRQRRAA